MKITIYSIGKTKESFVLLGETEYLKRLGPSAKIELKELGGKASESADPAETMLKEAEMLFGKLSPKDFLIVLDERGEELDSEGLSNYLSKKMTQGTSNFVFAIGGAWGFHESVKKRANLLFSLSKLTFPHQLARLFLIEQLYRAFSIMKGEPYHK